MFTTLRLVGAAAVLATLAACGATPAERGATGALVGGAIAAATDANLAEGALYGGAIGVGSCYVVPNAPNCVSQ